MSRVRPIAKYKHRECVVYGLYAPGGSRCRYVGATQNIHARLNSHRAPSVRSGASRAAWVEALRERGKSPRVVILERVADMRDLPAAEAAWIERMYARGEPLTNATRAKAPRRWRWPGDLHPAQVVTLRLDPILVARLDAMHRSGGHVCNPLRGPALCLRDYIGGLLQAHPSGAAQTQE